MCVHYKHCSHIDAFTINNQHSLLRQMGRDCTVAYMVFHLETVMSAFVRVCVCVQMCKQRLMTRDLFRFNGTPPNVNTWSNKVHNFINACSKGSATYPLGRLIKSSLPDVEPYTFLPFFMVADWLLLLRMWPRWVLLARLRLTGGDERWSLLLPHSVDPGARCTQLAGGGGGVLTNGVLVVATLSTRGTIKH